MGFFYLFTYLFSISVVPSLCLTEDFWGVLSYAYALKYILQSIFYLLILKLVSGMSVIEFSFGQLDELFNYDKTRKHLQDF